MRLYKVEAGFESVYSESERDKRERNYLGDRWAWWAIAHPDFGTSVNPIATRKGEGQIVPPTLPLAPQIFRPSDIPVERKELERALTSP